MQEEELDQAVKRVITAGKTAKMIAREVCQVVEVGLAPEVDILDVSRQEAEALVEQGAIIVIPVIDIEIVIEKENTTMIITVVRDDDLDLELLMIANPATAAEAGLRIEQGEIDLHP